MKRTILSLAVASSPLLLSGVAFADQVVVNDCNGGKRLVHQVSGSEKIDIQIALAKSATSPTVVLTNAKTGEKVQASVKNSLAVASVTPGIWTICDENSKLVALDTVTATETVSSLMEERVMALGAGGLGLAGVAVALANGGGNGNGDDGVGATTTLSTSGTSSSLSNSDASSSKTTSSAKTRADDCFVRDNTDVDPISPLS